MVCLCRPSKEGWLCLAVICTVMIAQTLSDESPSYVPVVLWHGMGDSCCNVCAMRSPECQEWSAAGKRLFHGHPS
jgi:hypothetical protein